LSVGNHLYLSALQRDQPPARGTPYIYMLSITAYSFAVISAGGNF
jgi:hypothetical protein